MIRKYEFSLSDSAKSYKFLSFKLSILNFLITIKFFLCRVFFFNDKILLIDDDDFYMNEDQNSKSLFYVPSFQSRRDIREVDRRFPPRFELIEFLGEYRRGFLLTRASSKVS